ncbi:YdeI/OmpD-associated family protein [Cohnella caldifontis]|uniref:YdeI/OmpD-associated family protein n=1 Tax=Cohnella caldifontis TaxID=3027471 RepID=UPI0023EB69CA|nr:YdeI/OmpD-associated family protein [Cohnella sp. YIM B05605]
MDEALAKKLRLPSGGRIAVLEAPDGFLPALGLTEAAASLEPGAEADYDFVLAFNRSAADVERLAPSAIRAVKPDGLLWLCYPKGTSKLKTDINRDAGWKPVSDAGWEGIALVSVDDTWSAMRFRPREAVGKSRPSPAERRAAAANRAPEAPPEPPEDLLAALKAAPEAEAAFGRLAPSHKKEYVTWILEAKKAETRASRIAKTVDKLSKGLKRPSDKE